MRHLALVLLAGCSGTVGDVSISLTTAPGSTLLDGVQTLRLTLTNPPKVTTAERTADGFDIVLDLPADGATGAVIVEGLDATGARIAVGQSPPFPFGGIDAHLVIYMAAPNTLGASPATLTPARTDLGIAALGYGAILAGGRDGGGAASDAVAIYNAFDHSLIAGLPLPAKRSGPSVGVGANNIAYLFGGLDESGAPTGSVWRFDTNAAPSGSYVDFGDKPALARGGERAVPSGSDHFLLTGMPAAELDGADGSVVARTEVGSLPPAGAAVVGTDGVATDVFAGPTGIIRFRTGAFATLDAASRPGAAVVALPGGKAAVVCAGPTVRVDAASGALESLPARGDPGCAAAATSRHLVIAGGTQAGMVSGAVEVDDATTLAPVATLALAVPRTGATAIALANDQVLILGGTDAAGAPIETIELFTPDVP